MNEKVQLYIGLQLEVEARMHMQWNGSGNEMYCILFWGGQLLLYPDG